MKYRLEIKETEKFYSKSDEPIPFFSCEILLNGKNFIDIISQYEKSLPFFIENKNSIGNYEGIEFRYVKKSLKKLNQRISIYQCKEHLNGDWELSFEIKLKGLNIYWENFKLKSERLLKIGGWGSGEYEEYSSRHPVNFGIEYKDFPEIKFNVFQYFVSLISQAKQKLRE